MSNLKHRDDHSTIKYRSKFKLKILLQVWLEFRKLSLFEKIENYFSPRKIEKKELKNDKIIVDLRNDSFTQPLKTSQEFVQRVFVRKTRAVTAPKTNPS
jgi:hypothetical protein